MCKRLKTFRASLLNSVDRDNSENSHIDTLSFAIYHSLLLYISLNVAREFKEVKETQTYTYVYAYINVVSWKKQ